MSLYEDIKPFCCSTRDSGHLQDKGLFELQTKLAAFFMEHNFYLKENLAENYSIYIWAFCKDLGWGGRKLMQLALSL